MGMEILPGSWMAPIMASGAVARPGPRNPSLQMGRDAIRAGRDGCAFPTTESRMSEPCPSKRLRPGRGGAALLAAVAAAVAVVPALARGAAPAAGPAGQPGAGSGSVAPTSSPATTAAVYRAAPAVSPAQVNGGLAATDASRGQRTRFRVGFAKELLDPSAADIAGGQLHLGGYGLF